MRKIFSLSLGVSVIVLFLIGIRYAPLSFRRWFAPSSNLSDVSGRTNLLSPVPTDVSSDPIVSIDDDPRIGDASAPLTLIEFSDFECPYCKRFFTDTLFQLKQTYIDTGKLQFVYRDLPLSFHDPLASAEAIAANCARAQGGDSAYFRFHDEIFTRTTSNGRGLNDEKIRVIARDLSLALDSFDRCLQDPAMRSEVEKDISDARKVGASATPTFLLGRTTPDGMITGDLLVGALPFSAFRALIDPMLQ